MKKSIFLLLTFLLSACSPQVTVTSEVTVTSPAPTQTPTLIPTPTEIPLESLSVEELAKKYLAGEMESGDRAGMPFAQAWLAESYSGTVPEHKRDGSYSNDLVFLRHIKGEAYFDLNGKPTPRIILEFGKVIRDGSGKPILLYKFLATQEGSATLFYQEGMNSKMGVNFTTHQEYMANIPANHMAWLGTYGTELSSVFYYAPQNAVDWPSLALHTPEAIAFLQDGKIPNSKIPLIQAKVVIFESDQQ